jgi:urea transport system permease protein
MNSAYEKLLGGKQGFIGLLVLGAVILVVFPLIFDAFRSESGG